MAGVGVPTPSRAAQNARPNNTPNDDETAPERHVGARHGVVVGVLSGSTDCPMGAPRLAPVGSSGAAARPVAAWGGSALIRLLQESSANSCHSSGTPLRRWSPRSANWKPDPTTRSLIVRDTRISPGPASRGLARRCGRRCLRCRRRAVRLRPACNPARASQPSCSTASTMASAQWMARPGPSKMASMPSPVNLSTDLDGLRSPGVLRRCVPRGVPAIVDRPCLQHVRSRRRYRYRGPPRRRAGPAAARCSPLEPVTKRSIIREHRRLCRPQLEVTRRDRQRTDSAGNRRGDERRSPRARQHVAFVVHHQGGRLDERQERSDVNSHSLHHFAMRPRGQATRSCRPSQRSAAGSVRNDGIIAGPRKEGVSPASIPSPHATRQMSATC